MDVLADESHTAHSGELSRDSSRGIIIRSNRKSKNISNTGDNSNNNGNDETLYALREFRGHRNTAFCR
jgi:hypothetical protein